MTRCGQFGQQRRHYGSSDGQTSPESLTISLVAGRPLETVQKHTSTPLAAKSQWRMAVFCNKIFFLFIRYVTKPHAAPVCGPVQGFPQRLSSILGRRGHHEPTQLRYSPFFLSRKIQFVSTTTKWATIQLNLLEAESDQNFGQMRFDAVTAKLYKVEHVKSNLHNIASTLKLDNLVRT